MGGGFVTNVKSPNFKQSNLIFGVDTQAQPIAYSNKNISYSPPSNFDMRS